MGEDKAVAKARLLMEKTREQYERVGALLEEIDKVLAGDGGIGATLKRLETAYDALWCSRYTPGVVGRYVWAYAQDRAGLKRLLRVLPADEVEARMARYVANDYKFYVRERHPFRLFIASINSHARVQPEAPTFALDQARAADAGDDPDTTDAAAVDETRRRMQDVRRRG